MSGVRLEAVAAALGYGRAPVLSDLSLSVAAGEILVVVGPSGCGKSTLLRGLAGLLPVAAGRILVDGEPVSGPSADRALIFQDDALLPWRSARRNVELPLALRRVPRAGRRRTALRWLAQVGLAEYEGRLPRELSGGMRQRVQLARTLAAAPRAILADEPFGALDTRTRSAMQRLFVQVWQANPATVVFVTHDIDEALLLADRIAVLGAGGLADTLDVPEPRRTVDRSPLRHRILAALGDGPTEREPEPAGRE